MQPGNVMNIGGGYLVLNYSRECIRCNYLIHECIAGVKINKIINSHNITFYRVNKRLPGNTLYPLTDE